MPCNDLYNEECRLFNAIRFEHDEEIRKYAMECVVRGLLEDYGNDKESVNEEFIITKAVCYMDEIGLQNAARYTNEIKNVYRNEVKRQLIMI